MTTRSVFVTCSIAEAVTLLQGRSRTDLDADRLLTLALVQLSQIIGEAARRVSVRRRKRHPEIPWPQIIAFRNRLIHGYDTIDFDILWQILTVNLPAWIAQLENIFSSSSYIVSMIIT
jgi:uncharacterized protein with HEPN domain